MTPAEQKILAEIKAGSKTIWDWSHTHTFFAGLVIGAVFDRVFGWVFF